MPKISKRPKILAKSNRFARKKPGHKLSLKSSEPELRSYPPNTWAILRPVNSAQLPFIFLTESFNCLGKLPANTSNQHQLPIDPRISNMHCYIRKEHSTSAAGISSSAAILEDVSEAGTMVDGILIKRDAKGEYVNKYKLHNGSRIDFPASRMQSGLYSYEIDIFNLDGSKFEQVYKLGKKLGSGHFSTVYMAKRIQCDGTTYAVKVLEKPSLQVDSDRQVKMIESEIQILNALNHKNLIKIFEYYDEPDKIYLVIEYVEDGEFFDFFKTRFMSEEEIRFIFVQLFDAIKYLHDNRIVHRDLKPENILMPSKEKLRIKVSDFGLSKLLNVDYSTMQTKCGTVSYVAPEVLESCRERSYNKEVDMWSAGVILYACLCGNLPFRSDNTRHDPQSVMRKVRDGNFPTDNLRWNNASDAAKSLVRGLLNKDVFNRLSVEQALDHSFIKCGKIPKSVSCHVVDIPNKSKKSNKSDGCDKSNELSADYIYYTCVGQFSQLSTSCESDESYFTASGTIRSYSSSEKEISSPCEGSF